MRASMIGKIAATAVALVAVVTAGSWWTADRMSNSVDQAVRAALTDRGLAGVDIVVDGRDVSVESLPSDVSAYEVRAALTDVDGVRTVTVDRFAGVGPAATATTSATSTAARTSTITAPVTTVVAAEVPTPPTVPVLFRVGVSTVDSEQVPVADRVAEFLLAHPAASVRVEGHTDSSGEEAVNLLLSEERARSVARILEQRGVAATRIAVAGLATARAAADNNTDTGRAANRRVEFIFE